MAVNKIEIIQGSEVIRPIDLTEDTVTVNDVMPGVTFHLPSGQQATGQSQAIIPEGTITITENNTTVNVAQYENADIQVQGGGSTNPYEEITTRRTSDEKGPYTFYFSSETNANLQSYFNDIKPNITRAVGLFWGASNLESVDFTGVSIGKPRDELTTTASFSIDHLFMNCNNLASINWGNLFDNMGPSLINPSRRQTISDTNNMFYKCSSLETIDLSIFAKISYEESFPRLGNGDRRSMFYGCSNLQQIILPNYGLGSITNAATMFYGCSSLTEIDLSNMSFSFGNTFAPSFYRTFYNCSNLQTIKLSLALYGYQGEYFKGLNYNQMFYHCNSLSTIITDTTKSEFKNQLSFYANMFNGNGLTQNDIVVICNDGVITYQNNGSGVFNASETYTLKDRPYTDGTTTYEFNPINKTVILNNAQLYNYEVTRNEEIVIADLNITFTMTAGDGSDNDYATQLTDNNGNIYNLVNQ